MPTFTQTVADLQADGPVINVHIAVPAAAENNLRSAGSAVPSPVQLRGLIDTGASGTCIQQGVAARLGLTPVGNVPVSTPTSTNVSCDLYLVRVILPHGELETTVIEAPMQGGTIEVLIGRDVLARGVLIYIGTSDQFTFTL